MDHLKAMSTRYKLVLFVTLGFVTILLAVRMIALPVYWRGLLMMLGGWLMAMGGLYQVRLYAIDKDTLYYVMIVFVGAYWIWVVVN